MQKFPVFTHCFFSPVPIHSNSPVGSALCVYTFGSNHNDLERVFQGQYQKQSGLGQFSPEPNNDYPNLVRVSNFYRFMYKLVWCTITVMISLYSLVSKWSVIQWSSYPSTDEWGSCTASVAALAYNGRVRVPSHCSGPPLMGWSMKCCLYWLQQVVSHSACH